MKTLNVLLMAMAVAIMTGKVRIDENKGPDEMEYVQSFDVLETKRATAKRPYLSLLDVDSMHCGIYSLPAGGVDGQQPHTEDEVYFVQVGEGKIKIHDKDYHIQPGSIIFVPAYAEHRFHSITKDLKLLVFFSKVKIDKPNKKSTDSD